jgi:hypothetical protein
MHSEPDPFASLRSTRAPFGSESWSFDSVFRRIMGLSRAAELERARRRASGGHSAVDALRIFARTLDVKALRKLETLMHAGRDAHALGKTAMALSEMEPGSARSTPDLFDERLASVENLRRGHAIACATRFDLEADVDGWPDAPCGDSLEDRVWLRFGRELAASDPNEWSCLAAIGPDAALEMLYLRRAEARWWSFGTQLDRPSAHGVSHRFEVVGRKRNRFVAVSIGSVVGSRCRSDRAALRRATMAVSARLGACRRA